MRQLLTTTATTMREITIMGRRMERVITVTELLGREVTGVFSSLGLVPYISGP